MNTRLILEVEGKQYKLDYDELILYPKDKIVSIKRNDKEYLELDVKVPKKKLNYE